MSSDNKIIDSLTNAINLIKTTMAKNNYSDKYAAAIAKLLNDTYALSKESDIRRYIADSIKHDNKHSKLAKCMVNPYMALIIRDCYIISCVTNARDNGYHIKFSSEDDKYSVEPHQTLESREQREPRRAVSDRTESDRKPLYRREQREPREPREPRAQREPREQRSVKTTVTKILERPRRADRQADRKMCTHCAHCNGHNVNTERTPRTPRQPRRPSITEIESVDLAKELEKAKFEDVVASNSWVDDNDDNDNADNTDNEAVDTPIVEVPRE